jgi:6-phosphogluconolactonase (cycloisomerase 2 family)
MSKKTSVVVALLGMCALSLFLASCGSSSSRPTGLLYVLSQAENNVSSYAIDLDNGDLSLITGNMPGTCPTAPCGIPLSISLDPTTATAFVLNQNSISGYTIGSDGSLSAPTTVAPITGVPVPVGSMLAMTRDAAGAFLFVISPGELPSATDCADQTVTDATCPSISVFNTKPGSTTMALASTSLLNRVPTALSVITFTPTGGSAETLLFVTSNLDLTTMHNDNELSVYAVDSSGNLTEQPNSPYTTQVNPGAVLAVNTNPVGQTTGGVFVYVGSQGAVTGSVSEFQLCTQISSGTVSCTQPDVTNNLLLSVGTPFSVGMNPRAMLVDPTSSFLYIACTGSNAVYGFHMITGTGLLNGLTPPTMPTGATPVALAMHPNFNNGAEFLYVSNNTGSSITGVNVQVTTGTLSNPQTVLFLPGEPSGIAGR